MTTAKKRMTKKEKDALAKEFDQLEKRHTYIMHDIRCPETGSSIRFAMSRNFETGTWYVQYWGYCGFETHGYVYTMLMIHYLSEYQLKKLAEWNAGKSFEEVAKQFYVLMGGFAKMKKYALDVSGSPIWNF